MSRRRLPAGRTRGLPGEHPPGSEPRSLNGILVIDKPPGPSSAQVVARVKRLLGAAKVGHTGTLDPFAEGVLVCCINQATRLVRFLMAGRKRYEGTLTLGVETDTLDATGRVVAEGDWHGIDGQAMAQVFRELEGTHAQVPPAYSALKHEGVPLYALARRGQPVHKPPREVSIERLRVLAAALPQVRFEVSCSAGTYVRVLAADIGRRLGCGAHLSRLVRLETSGFTREQAQSLDQLEALCSRADGLEEVLVPMARALSSMPQVVAGDSLLEKIRRGRRLSREDFGNGTPPPPGPPGGFVKVVDARGELAAVLQCRPQRDTWDYAGVFLPPEG